MYALVGVWTTTGPLGSEHQEELETRIVPLVRNLPDFVQGYWTADQQTGKLHSFIVFEEEGGVRGLKDVVESDSQAQARAGISYDSLSIVTVEASAAKEFEGQERGL
jgi:hypothetical protein